jgi:hypothetical protein
MKAFELSPVGANYPTQVLHATSERAANKYAEKNGLRIVRELIQLIIK